MAKQVTHYKCLVISPSDVDDARAAIREALLDWNAHAGEGLGVKVEAVLWESHSRPEMGKGPQDILNQQIVDDCDFGNRGFLVTTRKPNLKARVRIRRGDRATCRARRERNGLFL